MIEIILFYFSFFLIRGERKKTPFCVSGQKERGKSTLHLTSASRFPATLRKGNVGLKKEGKKFISFDKPRLLSSGWVK